MNHAAHCKRRNIDERPEGRAFDHHRIVAKRIAAVYSGKELVDVDTVTAPSAYEVTLNVTKLTDTDTPKRTTL